MALTETKSWKLGIDVGGTFTDLTALDEEGRITATKPLPLPIRRTA
ncbi:hypothetical protein HMSSN036_39690 [Paenibacillus macerans]|nr:hypothetical protein HMSSN036_39690 [Paenibacillus macerans]